MPNGERYLDIHEVGRKLGGRSARTVKRMVERREIPLPFLWRGSWHWLESDFDLWMRRQAIEHEIDPETLVDDESLPDEARTNLDKPGQTVQSRDEGQIPPSGTKKRN